MSATRKPCRVVTTIPGTWTWLSPTRMTFQILILICLALTNSGCIGPSESNVDEIKVWGQRGLGDGQFQKPRAVAYGPDGNVYIVDMTARIQVFDTDGNFLRSWRTPEYKIGKPCGLSFSNDGKLMVADTHYFRILFYSLDGTLDESRTIGGTNGTGPGEFGFVTDVVQDSKGNYYVSEYGDFDRIQKFDSNGKFLYQWGEHGDQAGQFLRPQGLWIDANDQLWIADAANHRIQVFDVSGDQAEFVKFVGQPGRSAGQLSYPYDLFLDPDQNIYICEFGTHRIQKFDSDGKLLGSWGEAGREPGQLHQPWGMCMGPDDLLFVLDSYNHRIQRLNVNEIQ